MEKKWWHNQVVYQVYPRSFKDTTGSGIGDINGITEKLDYLQKLGIGIIWLSPVYKSPMDDNGYDISDYCQIDPSFGSMEDFDRLVREGLKRNIRIVMDLVVNHTSDEHPWFIESKSSPDNPKRDWYIWKKPGANGEAPNNWGSFFTRSAWALDEATGDYYLHLFSKKQPDLNWANPEVRHAVYDMMHFWLKKGIGGFRMDVINFIGKPVDFPDAVLTDNGVLGHEYFANNSRTHEYLREMNREVLSKYDILTVGETSYVNTTDGIKYTHKDRHELDTVFHFEHMNVDSDSRESGIHPIHLPELKKIMAKWQDDLHGKGWTANYWSNHDQPRAVSRFGNDGAYRIQSAKMLGATLHMMFGTPYIYQGEEVGLTNTYYETMDDYDCIEMRHGYDLLINDEGLTPEEAVKRLAPRSRDNARVPVRWDSSDHAGFTTGKPWLKIPEHYKNINVAEALEDEASIFYFYQKLVQLRKDSPYSDTITYGNHHLLMAEHEQVYAYERYDDNHRLLILSNFSDQPCPLALGATVQKILLSNYGRVEVNLSKFEMAPYETLILEL